MIVRGEADSDVSIGETGRPGSAAFGDRPESRASPDRAERGRPPWSRGPGTTLAAFRFR
jgi:hypothetical protein